jgi:RNA polymerase sigma-70 factor (ECF subfamily)
VIDRNDYSHWLRVASRWSRRRDEAEDLLQDALLAAVKASRTDLGDPKDRAWFAGVIRRKALMEARSGARRRRREASLVKTSNPASASDDQTLLALVQRLPRASRIVATLALHGLNRAEIASVLDLSPTALRQRITSIRRAMRNVERDIEPRFATIAGELEAGLLRRSLLGLVRRQGGFGTHDPDGHLILFARRGPHNSSPGGNGDWRK